MKPLVFNSTPLIYLSKAGLSGIIENLQEEKLTSPLVKAEVVDKGKQKGVPDAIALEKLFENGVFKLCKPKDNLFLSRLSKTRGLHAADAEVLALAKEHGGWLLLMMKWQGKPLKFTKSVTWAHLIFWQGRFLKGSCQKSRLRMLLRTWFLQVGDVTWKPMPR